MGIQQDQIEYNGLEVIGFCLFVFKKTTCKCIKL